MFLRVFCTSGDMSLSIITSDCRTPISAPGTESINTGQASKHAPQVVHAQASSTWIWPSTLR